MLCSAPPLVPHQPPPSSCGARSDSARVEKAQPRPDARFHLRTGLWRADMQALVFHQNANNIICNIQGNIIVVLIGEKKNVDGCTCPPHHPVILITEAEIKRGRGGGRVDLFRRCGDAGVWVSQAGQLQAALGGWTSGHWLSGAGTSLSRWSSLPHDLFMAPHGGAGRSLRGSLHRDDMCGGCLWAASMRVASLIHVRGE